MTVDAEPLGTADAVMAAAQAAANALLGRAGKELTARCDALVLAYAAADEALLRYESLAAAEVVKEAYEGVRAARRRVAALSWLARRKLDRVDSAIVDRRIVVTKTMSAHVTAWFQLHAALTERRAQAMHLLETARARVVGMALSPLQMAPLRDEQLGEAERIAQNHRPDELRRRLKRADGSIKRQIGGDFGADVGTQPLDPDDD